MTNWTIETMVYCPRGSKSGRAAADIFVGKRNSADGGKTWIEEGEVHGTFDDSFSNVKREVNYKKYQSRELLPRCSVA